MSVIEYQTLVLRGDLDAASELLQEIPESEKGKIARFLEGQGYKELALEVATDGEHRFELALALGELGIAIGLAREADVEHKWKTVGDAALTAWDVRLAEECFLHARDLGSLLLLYSSSANAEGLRNLAAKAREAGQHNVAFTCLWQVGDVEGCLDVLTGTGRLAEAVLFAQTYRPSACGGFVGLWKSGLEGEGKGKVARVLGMPGEDEEMFPEWEEWLREEREGGDLIDVSGGVNGEADKDGVVEAKGKVAPVDADADADGEEDGEVTPQTETEV